MSKPIVAARIENVADLDEVATGRRRPDQVRSAEVADALVDTEVPMLGLPRHLIAHLGLMPQGPRTWRLAGGTVTFPIYHPVRLTAHGHHCTCEVMELDDALPVLIGRMPLQLLDLVIDPDGRRLVGTPDHGG
jgi:hypothetical protein